MIHTSRQIPELSCHTSLSQYFTLMNGIDSIQEQPLHKQKYYEIQYIVSGQGYITVNSQKLFLSTGDYVIILPEDKHSLKTKQSIRYYSLEFTVQDSFSEYSLYRELKNIFLRSADTPVTVCKNTALKSIFENLFREWKDRHTLYVSYITLLFQQILIQCCRTHPEDQPPEEATEKENLLDTLLAFIDAYMDKPDVLTLFEKNYGVKRTVLSQLSKQKFGKTVFQLYTDKRFEYARNLLADGKTSITEIAGRCAFSSVAAFSKAFTHYYGMSPSRYIQEYPLRDVEIPLDVYVDFSTCSVPVSGTIMTGNQPDKPQSVAEYTNPKFQLF